MPTFVADEVVTAAKLNNATARDWTDWVPTTNITVGSGTLVARYMQLGSELVVCYLAFTFGSGSAMPTAPTATLPVTAAATVDTQSGLGKVRVFDTPSAAFLGTVTLTSSTVAIFQVDRASGTYTDAANITASIPMVWATGDKLIAQWAYEGA